MALLDDTVVERLTPSRDVWDLLNIGRWHILEWESLIWQLNSECPRWTFCSDVFQGP